MNRCALSILFIFGLAVTVRSIQFQGSKLRFQVSGTNEAKANTTGKDLICVSKKAFAAMNLQSITP